jgi:hypothetical protein
VQIVSTLNLPISFWHLIDYQWVPLREDPRISRRGIVVQLSAGSEGLDWACFEGRDTAILRP